MKTARSKSHWRSGWSFILWLIGSWRRYGLVAGVGVGREDPSKLKSTRGATSAPSRAVKYGLGEKPEESRKQRSWHCLHGCVVALNRFIKFSAFHRNPVLSSLELRLQLLKVRVGLQFRITFHNDQQTGKRVGQLILRCWKRWRVCGSDGATFGSTCTLVTCWRAWITSVSVVFSKSAPSTVRTDWE